MKPKHRDEAKRDSALKALKSGENFKATLFNSRGNSLARWFLSLFGKAIVYRSNFGTHEVRYDSIDAAMSRPIHKYMSVAPPWAKRVITTKIVARCLCSATTKKNEVAYGRLFKLVAPRLSKRLAKKKTCN